MKFKLKYIMIVGGICLWGFLLAKSFIGEYVYVSSASMFPTYLPEEKVWHNKCAYGILLPRRIIEVPILNLLYCIPFIREFDQRSDWGYHRLFERKKPDRMDIIIFKWKPLETQRYIKRVVGIPGDTIQLKAGVVYVNGKELHEKGRTRSWDDYGPVIVPKDTYFVLGDNRGNSIDSRKNGVVAFQNVVGEVLTP